MIAIEVATFRHDGAYSDGRRPDAVRFSTDPREDVVRRDFTINGMLLDVARFERDGDLDGAVLDFVGGRADLAVGVVRADWGSGSAVCGRQAADAAGSEVRGAAWLSDRGAGDVCGDARACGGDRAGELRSGFARS